MWSICNEALGSAHSLESGATVRDRSETDVLTCTLGVGGSPLHIGFCDRSETCVKEESLVKMNE